ncbi:MAG: IS1 family transposase, partial [Chloroflexi bacterium]|nr:IS1 family transposase [Chloroflexota bacterium]
MGKWKPNSRQIPLSGGQSEVSLIKRWQTRRVSMAHWSVECKGCGSSDVIRHGIASNGQQRFLCKSCGITFVGNNAPPGMRFPTEVIGYVLREFYESASLSKIQRGIQMTYQMRPDPSNIYRWIVRYSRKAV